MSIAAFADHLRVARSTVAAWEDPAASSAPAEAAQQELDQVLKLASHDVRTRFRLILQDTVTDADHTGASEYQRREHLLGHTTVTPLRGTTTTPGPRRRPPEGVNGPVALVDARVRAVGGGG